MKFRDQVAALSLLLLTSAIATAAGSPGELADAKGCKFVLPSPVPPGTELKWDGACDNGYLSGPGTAEFGPITYKGEFKQGAMTRGEVTAMEGYKYTGELAGNKPRGRGETRLPSGVTVKGQFSDDPNQITGIAEITWPDGAVYTGEVDKVEVMHGKGKLVYANGYVYEGTFRQNQFHGQGKSTDPAGESYEGGFAYSRYHGQGTLVFINGSRYVGEFANGERHGKGRLEHVGGGFDEGEWKASRLQGQCHIKYAVGSEYTGQCVNGELSGQGKFQDATVGAVYEGAFLANQYHGQGRLTQAGYVYEGDFVGGVKSGKGKEVFETGEQYEGMFARNVREGAGVLRAPMAGGIELAYDGAFKNGLLHGTGKMKLGEATFDGEFKLGVFNKGRVQGKDGRVLEIDVEQDSVFEIRPDGTKVPVDPDQPLDPQA